MNDQSGELKYNKINIYKYFVVNHKIKLISYLLAKSEDTLGHYNTLEKLDVSITNIEERNKNNIFITKSHHYFRRNT